MNANQQLAAIDEKIIETRARRNELVETAETRSLDETEKRNLASVKEDLTALEEKRDRVHSRGLAEAAALEARQNHVTFGMETRNSELEHDDIATGTIRDLFEGRSDNLTLHTRDMLTSATGAGAETMATKVESAFYKVLDQYSGLWRVGRKRPTGDDESTLVLPILSGYGDGDQERTEGTAITADDAVTSSISFGAYTYSALTNISNKLRNSSAVDIDELVTEELAQRLVRGYRARLAVGTGSGQPQGITVGAGAGVTAAATAAVTSDELVELVHSVAPEVRDVTMSSWVMHDQTWLAIRSLKDGDGRYLVGDLGNGAAMTLLGYPVQVDNAMPTMATGTKPIVFGAVSTAFQIRHTNTRIDISRDAKFAEDETSFRAIIALDSKVVDATAIKAMTMA